MTANALERPVSPAAFRRSQPMPLSWALTFGWSWHYDLNQEDGLVRPEHLPTWKDVNGPLTDWRFYG